MKKVKRGEIYLADLGEVNCYSKSSIQAGYRPVVILQNDITTKNSNVVTVAPVTSRNKTKKMKSHITIDGTCGISKESLILLEQITTIDKSQLDRKIGILTEEKIQEVRESLMFVLDL